ncbi:hypothetical protein FRC12_020522 [Ceratobasidium sp. 428]|nr:hypothetical protein FRC12_020522 [Ceratobasidium sp. 428]
MGMSFINVWSAYRKRKLDTENDLSLSKREAAAFVEEVDILQMRLEERHAPTLVRALVDSLDDCRPQTIQMFKALIDPILQANKEPRHCVRCHETYHEVENRSNSCVVSCSSVVSSTGWFNENDERMVKSRCCGRVRREKEKAEGDIVCYRTRHTANVSDVKYFKGRDRGEKGIKHNGYNPGVLTCAETGCNDDDSELSDPLGADSS